ncbi:MAG TPA: DUF6282 family protein [Bryobacteraceae bacterium]
MSQYLEGVIDIHAHCGPDSIPRSLDGVQLAEMARDHGMRGLVLKNHFEPTASLAYLVRKQVPQIAVFGGITLNLATGGMNPRAVEHMALVSGGQGRCVWMGSLDTESHRRFTGEDRPFVSISRDGALLPETKDVISVIAEHRLILATGHSTTDEVLMLVREARRQGVRKVVVTHAMMAPTHMLIGRMCEAAEMGAFIEFVYNGLIGIHKEFEPLDYAEAICAVGPQRCIVASDLGQAANPPHPEGLIAFFTALRREGLSQSEIARMSRHNPALLLDLD